MVEETDTGWWDLIENQGLHQTAHILEEYGIDSETDVSELDQDDFNKMELKSFDFGYIRETYS